MSRAAPADRWQRAGGGIRITVLGGCGAWPAAGQACSGYLVEHEDLRLLVDPGYAILPRLLELCLRRRSTRC
jgi:ribonuclease BN (tRNA processing enzyme)